MASIFLATFIEKTNMGETGWKLVLAWAVWMMFLPILIEFLQIHNENKPKVEAFELTDNKILAAKSNSGSQVTLLLNI